MQDYSGGDPTAAIAAMSGLMGIFLLVGLAMLVLVIVFWWKIFSKAGYNGALSLIFLASIIPLIGWVVPIALIGWFAFAEWPALKNRGGTPPVS
jgi:glycerol-3-phosphate acyltransferase PlsY